LNKTIIIVLVFLFLASNITGSISSKQELFYSDGNTLYVGGIGPGNHSSIQSAIQNASDEDTVFVYSGAYQLFDTLNINKSIQLIGEREDTTIIQPNESGTNQLILIQAEKVMIKQFTFLNIVIKNNANNVTITDNLFIIDVFKGYWTNSVISSQASYFIVKENIISLINLTDFEKPSPRCGIDLHGFHSFALNNTISGASTGLDIGDKGGDILVLGNTFSQNSNGLFVSDQFPNALITNTITRNNFMNNDIQALFTIRVESIKDFFTGLFLGFPSQNWDGNYWSDHPTPAPREIPGRLHVILGDFIVNDINVYIDWSATDNNPLEAPI